MNISIGTITRTVILAVALINQALTISGHSVIPITDEQIAEIITLAITIGASVLAWWKNNSFTKSALVGDQAMEIDRIESKLTDEAKEEFNDGKGVEDNE